ncbi:MAG: c-type cytochrome [Gammaproteobacteria bacterium]|nr:c-type cytochrome [Gammaproteobacteria bacterium]
MPVDQPVKFLLRSKDVLHNFAVAQFRVKMDLVPGLVTYMWLTPTREGTYDILCEELCGIGHFAMRGQVVVESAEDFNAWRDELMTFAESRAMQPPDPVAGKALYATCVSCHGADGSGNPDLNAPRITGLGEWYVARQLELQAWDSRLQRKRQVRSDDGADDVRPAGSNGHSQCGRLCRGSSP